MRGVCEAVNFMGSYIIVCVGNEQTMVGWFVLWTLLHIFPYIIRQEHNLNVVGLCVH